MSAYFRHGLLCSCVKMAAPIYSAQQDEKHSKQTNKKSTRRSEVESDEQTDRLDKRGVRMCERRRGD